MEEILRLNEEIKLKDNHILGLTERVVFLQQRLMELYQKLDLYKKMGKEWDGLPYPPSVFIER